MAASLIDRLPSDKRVRALQLLSRNANAPGAAVKRTGRSVRRDFAKRAGELGIILIESDVTAALTANVGCVNPPGVATVSIDTGGGTPASADITTSELEAVTWAAPGAQLLTVSAPTNCKGAAVVVV